MFFFFFFFSSRRRHTRLQGDWSSDVCSSDLAEPTPLANLHLTLLEKAGIHLDSLDRKSTRLNSSHLVISYAVFCLKKKKALRHSCTAPASASRPNATCWTRSRSTSPRRRGCW